MISNFGVLMFSLSSYLITVVDLQPLPRPVAPDVVVFAAPQTQVNSKQIYGGGGRFGGGGGGYDYPNGPGSVGGYGDLEYDDGYNTGYGYGSRVGSQRTAYANYLAYYGIGMYNNGGGIGRSGCLQRCRRQGRVNCAAVCRSFG